MDKKILAIFLVGAAVGAGGFWLFSWIGEQNQVTEVDIQRINSLPQNTPREVKDIDVLLGEGFLRFRKGEMGKALVFAEQALRQDQTNPEALLLKAYSLFNLGRKEEAKTALEQVLAISPDNAPAKLLISQF